MKIELVHPAIPLCLAWNDLLLDCETLGRFCSRIDRFSKKIEDTPQEQSNPYYHQSGGKAAKKFKGDVFEVFGELLIRLSPLDDRLGIHDYHVVTENDTGVDGYGKAGDGSPATVQIKYRLWDKILDEINAGLHRFSTTSRNRHNIDTESNPAKMILITTGRELSWKARVKFMGGMRCISRDASYGCLRGAPHKTVDSLFSLKTIVDNNVLFWDTFRAQTGIKDD